MNSLQPAENLGLLLGLAVSCKAAMPSKIVSHLFHERPCAVSDLKKQLAPEVVFQSSLPKGEAFSTIIPVDNETLLCTTHSLPESAYLFNKESGFKNHTILPGQTCGAVADKDHIHISLFKGTIETYDHQLNHKSSINLHVFFPQLKGITISNCCLFEEDKLLLSISSNRSYLAIVPLNGKPSDARLFEEAFLRESNYVWRHDDRVLTTIRLPYGILSVHLNYKKGVAHLESIAKLNSFPLNIWPAGAHTFVSQKDNITVFDCNLKETMNYSINEIPELFHPTPWPFISGLNADPDGLLWVAHRGGDRIMQIAPSSTYNSATQKG